MKKCRSNNLLQRIFSICPHCGCRNIGFRRRLIDHTIAGGLLGFLILHPLSIIAHNFFHLDLAQAWKALGASLSYEHITMTIYFTLIGSILGIIHGIYIHFIYKLNEEIRRQSITDELTGLYNRRFFINRLDQETARAQRYRHPLSLLMVDIDFFKNFNDKHGHPAGDELLRRLGTLLRDMIRGSDFAARYGGEEFAIVMPETDAEMACEIAQRICVLVSDHPFRHRETLPGGSVTVSIGMAGLPGDAQEMEQLIQSADQALYKAKTKGKNQVCKFNSEWSTGTNVIAFKCV
jgi:diguanylate cyclase (GGDEF)-like protein